MLIGGFGEVRVLRGVNGVKEISRVNTFNSRRALPDTGKWYLK